MALPAFYSKNDTKKTTAFIEKEKADRENKLTYQRNLTLEEKKKLFNRLEAKDKKRCLVNLDKKEPLSPGEIENTWWDKKGKNLSDDEMERLKRETAHYSIPDKFFCWKRINNHIYLEEFDSKMRKTGKSCSIIIEKNDLAILIKGENFIRSHGLITFDKLRNKKNS